MSARARLATLLAAAVASLLLLAATAQATPMTFTVNSTADPGTGSCDVSECTLREAITAANANPGVDTIQFNLDTSSFPPHAIQPASALPTITEGVAIDGTTQPDYFHEPAVAIDGTNAGASVAGLTISASSTVKALDVSNFSGDGISLTGGTSTLQGNAVGASGPNGGAGIAIGSGSSGNSIGGTGVDQGNGVFGSGGAGIAVSSGGNHIEANSIESNTGDGVAIATGSNNAVGGTAAGAGNTIDSNGGNGVSIAAGTGNAVEGNSIDFDTGLGIDLGAAGVTANDHLDPDSGANNLQNFPAITGVSADTNAGTTNVTGTLDSVASTTYRVEIFASDACNASGNGEGFELVDSTDVTTNGSGAGSFNRTFATPGGSSFTATATDPNGNTSEFSTCAQGPAILTVDRSGTGSGTVTSSPAGINCGSTCSAEFTSNSTVTLHAAPDSGMTFAGWSGDDCTGTSDCVLTMNAAKNVTATFTDPSFALHLAQAMTHDQSIITGATLTAPPNGTPDLVQTASLAGYPTDGSSYGIMTSGDAHLAGQPNDSSGSGAADGGANVRGNSDYDVSILKIDLNVPNGANCLTFDFRFFSEEYPEFVGSSFNDAFVAELDTSDWTTSGSAITAPHNFAFDPDGHVISINSTGETAMSAANATGTTYDGGTAPLHASTVVTSGAHSVYLSIFDQGDPILDSAVFVDNLVLSTRTAAACASGATSDTTPPTVTLTTPANGSSTSDTTPTFSGTAGTAAGDLDTITVNVYSGNTATGTPVQTLTTTQSGGAWSVDASTALAPGTYTAQAQQSDSAGNTGYSSANTFTVTSGGPVQRHLTVNKAGTGSGTVTSSPAAINCGATCSADFDDGTVVTLTAAPAAGSSFTGWSGDCTGTGSCQVTMSAARSVTASFAKIQRQLTVSKSGTGSGTVTSSPAGIDCGATCSGNYDDGTVVTLTATPASGSTFTGWSGDCTGTASCVVTMSAARSVTASFSAAPTGGGDGGVGGVTTPPGQNLSGLFCGVQHRGHCNGLQFDVQFTRPGNAVWQFGAYNPSPGRAASAAAVNLLLLGKLTKTITKPGKVHVVFKLKKSAKNLRLYKKIKRLRLSVLRIRLTFTPTGGSPKVVTRKVKLRLNR